MRKTTIKLMCFCTLTCLVSSCIERSDELDLNKDINLDIAVAADGMTIPLGSLDKIYLDSLLDTDESSSDVIKKLSSGQYGIVQSDSIDDISISIDPVFAVIEPPTIDPISTDFQAPGGFSITGEFVTPINDSTTVDMNVPIDNTILSISDLSLTKPSALNFALGFANVSQQIDSIVLDNFVIEFPSLLVLGYQGTDSRVAFQDGKITINGNVVKNELTGNGFSVQGLSVVDLYFETDPVVKEQDATSMVVLGQKVKFHGDAIIRQNGIEASELSGITIQPTISFDTIFVKDVTAKLDPQIDPIVEKVALDLGEDLEFLKNKDNHLGLSNPELALNLTTSLPLPISLDMIMSSVLDGQILVENVVPDFGAVTVPSCPAGLESKEYCLLFYSNEKADTISDDTIFVRFSRFADLLATIPDSISISIEAGTDTENEYTVNLADKFLVSGGYSVNVPLEFKNMSICYTDTIDGISEDLADASDITKNLGKFNFSLSAKVESTIPLGLTISAKALDKNGDVLPSITLESAPILAGSKDNPAVSDLLIAVAAGAGSLEKLDAIVFEVKCESGQTSASLDDTEYIYIYDVALNIPDGIEMDLSDL